MSDMERRLAQAEHWRDLLDVLEGATQDDIPGLTPLIPELASHRNWCIRSEVMCLIGELRVEELLPVLQEALRDRNVIVRTDALESYYLIEGEAAVETIRAMCVDRDVRMRVAALCLLYVECHEGGALRTLRRILARKRCLYHHQYVALHTFEDHEMLGDPAVRELLTAVRAKVRPEMGIAKDLDRALGSDRHMGQCEDR